MESITTSDDIPVLHIDGHNYLEWKVGVSTYLTAIGLQGAIVDGNTASPENKAKATMFLRRHIHQSLKYEFLLVDDPKVLLDNLNKRYGCKESIFGSNALNAWTKLRFQKYDSVSEYNLHLSAITSRLKLSGRNITEAEKLQKTFTTMHPWNTEVRQECEAAGYTNHSDLISTLLTFEQSGKLKMYDHGRLAVLDLGMNFDLDLHVAAR